MRPWRLVALGAGIAGVVLGLCWRGWSRSARARWDEAVRAWEAELGPIDAILAAHPDAGPSDTAFALEEVAAALGVTVSALPGPAQPSRIPEETWSAITDHVMAEMQARSPGTAMPPPDLESFLGDREVEIDRVVDVLLAGPPPRWTVTADAGMQDVPLGPVLGLHRLLCAAALVDLHRGRHARAGCLAAAARQLARGLDSRPEVSSQMHGGFMLLEEQGLLRALPAGVAPAVTDGSRRSVMRKAVALEGWRSASELLQPQDCDRYVVVLPPPTRLERAWLRIRMALPRRPQWVGAADVLHLMVDFLRADDRAGSCPPAGFRPPAEAAWFDLDMRVEDARHFDFHRELTTVIQQARRSRVTGPVRGSCEHWSFHVDVLTDRRMLVTTLGPPPPPDWWSTAPATTWVEPAP